MSQQVCSCRSTDAIPVVERLDESAHRLPSWTPTSIWLACCRSPTLRAKPTASMAEGDGGGGRHRGRSGDLPARSPRALVQAARRNRAGFADASRPAALRLGVTARRAPDFAAIPTAEGWRRRVRWRRIRWCRSRGTARSARRAHGARVAPGTCPNGRPTGMIPSPAPRVGPARPPHPPGIRRRRAGSSDAPPSPRAGRGRRHGGRSRPRRRSGPP